MVSQNALITQTMAAELKIILLMKKAKKKATAFHFYKLDVYLPNNKMNYR